MSLQAISKAFKSDQIWQKLPWLFAKNRAKCFTGKFGGFSKVTIFGKNCKAIALVFGQKSSIFDEKCFTGKFGGFCKVIKFGENCKAIALVFGQKSSIFDEKCLTGNL